MKYYYQTALGAKNIHGGTNYIFLLCRKTENGLGSWTYDFNKQSWVFGTFSIGQNGILYIDRQSAEFDSVEELIEHALKTLPDSLHPHLLRHI